MLNPVSQAWPVPTRRGCAPLDVLVHDALLVQLAQRFGDAERDPQEDP